MQKLYKPLSAAAAAMLILSFLLTLRYGAEVGKDITGGVLRLHIIANSDNEYDQAQKLRLRDAVLKNCRQYFENCSSAEESVCCAKAHIGEIQKVCEDFLLSENSGADISVSVGKSRFPTRVYGGFALPAGTYNALKIVIGSGEGRNWWCVMYPSLCFTDSVRTNDTLEKSFSPEVLDCIKSGAKPGISLKFKIVELLQQG